MTYLNALTLISRHKGYFSEYGPSEIFLEPNIANSKYKNFYYWLT